MGSVRAGGAIDSIDPVGSPASVVGVGTSEAASEVNESVDCIGELVAIKRSTCFGTAREAEISL
jgi:hypothetical protein